MKPRSRPLPASVQAKQRELDAQRRRFAAIKNFPGEFCTTCKAREPWVDLCAACKAKMEAWAR